MNILIVHNYYKYPGGEDIVVENEMNMLKEHGHKVYLYSRSNKELDEYNTLKKLLLPFSTIFSLKSYKEISRLIKKRKIDVVHVHNTLTQVSPSVYYAAFKHKVPVVQTMHNFRLLCPAATFYRKGRVCEKCLNKGLGCAVIGKCYRNSFLQTLVSSMTLWIHRMFGTYSKLNYICLTEFNKKKLLNLKGVKEKKIYIKPNFVRPVQLEKRTIRKDYYIYVGRLEKLKGIDKLLKAWELMGDNAPKLVICGTGELDSKCERFIKSKNLNMITLKGYVDSDQVRALMEGAKALIFPSQCYETFGMSIAEAFSVRTPVIASDLGNAANLVREGETGLHFKHDDPNDLKRKIELYESFDSKQRKSFRDKAAEEYKNNYTQEANYEMLMQIYTSVRK